MFLAQKKSVLAQINKISKPKIKPLLLGKHFFCLKANGKGLIIGFEIFEYGPSKPELWLVRKTSICVTFFHFWEKYWF